MIYRKLGNKLQMKMDGVVARCKCGATQFKGIKVFNKLIFMCNECGRIYIGGLCGKIKEVNGE